MSASSFRDPGPVPPRWLSCPRKSHELVAGKFLAFKTPLDNRFDSKVEHRFRFAPDMIFASMKSYRVKIGLWIDLCNTSRFYDKALIEGEDCKYVKLHCKGHGETPSEEQVGTFVRIVSKFIRQHPLEVIAVHCTHGFNRTGFLVSAYLIQIEDWSPEAALAAFAKARPPGIYKEDYIQDLFRRFGDESEAPAAPPLPDWCFEEDGPDEVDTSVGEGVSGEASDANGQESSPRKRKREFQRRNPQFMPGVPGVHVVTDKDVIQKVQWKVQDMCGWTKSGFPGAQPVSMDRENLRYLEEMPYKVSWKADGTRYMMLIDGKDQIFFIDRDNSIFQVENMTFLHRKFPKKHLTDTLLDGEMVIDEVEDKRFPRYLAYDILKFQGEDVGNARFSVRLLCIEKEIVQTRAKYIQEGKIDKSQEPFSIRLKQFWPLSGAATLLGPKFTKASLGHEPDGLVFQPAETPYKAGRDDRVLKWKPSSHNSVDFKLQVVKEKKPGMLPTTTGLLYVGGMQPPFAQMPKLRKDLRDLHNKIIECTWDNAKSEWVFMRERTDKSYPNGYATAQGVIKSIMEPVTTEMLLNFISNHQFRRPADLQPPLPKMQKMH